MLRLIQQVDNSSYANDHDCFFLKSDNGSVLGKMIKSVVSQLECVPWLRIEGPSVLIVDSFSLTTKFFELVNNWRKNGTFDCLKGWRNELYTCYLDNEPYFQIERSAACLFGLVTYGCHITGYNPKKQAIWVPRRSSIKQTYPGMLDNTVAGGLGDDLGFWECAIKECYEEAGLERSYVTPRLKQTGVVTYEFVDPTTGYYQPEVECVYDLVMEDDTVPKPVDGEAQDFQLMSYDEVRIRMLNGEFKYNCALVLIDFFIRHGVITIENEPDYLEIVSRCHRRLEYPLKINL